MFKYILLLLFVLIIAKASWASPFSENLPNQKPHAKTLKEMEQVLFPTHLDGASESVGFRLIPSSKKAGKDFSFLGGELKRFPYIAPGSPFEPMSALMLPPTVASGNGGAFLSGSGNYLLTHNFLLQGQYSDFQSFSVNQLQDPNQFDKILRTSSLGIAYPLTSRLTLSGHYGVAKGQGQESVSPFFGAIYRMSTATSVSVSYGMDDPSTPRDEQNTSAELKIHF